MILYDIIVHDYTIIVKDYDLWLQVPELDFGISSPTNDSFDNGWWMVQREGRQHMLTPH